MNVRIAISCIPHETTQTIHNIGYNPIWRRIIKWRPLYEWYMKKSTDNPYITSMITGGTILTSADIAAQLLTTNRYII